MLHTGPKTSESPWPHRWAVALACAAFPLLWVGGLVTTTDAGMAVPDWPSTYGYNLFLYPWQTWISGPWDVFVEHGHRLLASVVGLITVGLVVVVWWADGRRWMRGCALAALALVIGQGVLGGMRVLLDERTLAMLHGITGPLFFGLAVALVVLTSKTWMSGATGSASAFPITQQSHGDTAHAASIRRLAIVTCILAYLQIVLGAVLRHIPVAAEPTTFALAVKFHMFLAAALSLHILVFVWWILHWARQAQPLAGLAGMLFGLLVVQLLLGVTTWIVKYSVPFWASGWLPPLSQPIQVGGPVQTHVITAHVAVGSLLFGVSIAAALYAGRLPSSPRLNRPLGIRSMEAAV
jgi:cytochrome c oxidase assembly protein subunit 15